MLRHENKTFENQHLVLDDGVFINCVFKNCSLEYSGGDTYVQNGTRHRWSNTGSVPAVLAVALVGAHHRNVGSGS